MKKIASYIVILMALTLSSCEEVIDVDLDTAETRLVVEAPILWQKNTSGRTQRIKLSTTTSFFNEVIPSVSGAKVTVANSTNRVFNFNEVETPGEYYCTNFIPEINETYTLTIELNGVTYTAIEKLQSVAPIDEVTQDDEGGIARDEIQIKTFFDDPANEVNFYLFQYAYKDELYQNLSTTDDDFFQGNRFFSLSSKDDIEVGDEVTVTHYGISKSYYNYLSILIKISGGDSGGPFQSPPATVRGNIINTTNKDNYALGYFSLGEIDSKTYTVQ